MDDSRNIILNASNRMISKLQLLSVFFEDDLIFKIYVRTQIIHKLFENNHELDINKLQLFHLQFTETIVELLKKIKKNNEINISLAQDEIQLDEELIVQISHTMRVEEDFGHAQQAQAMAVNQCLYKLYQNLSNLSADAPFSKTVGQFSFQFSRDFFHEVDINMINEFVDFNPERVYKNGYGIIEKRLLGSQCRRGFKNIFYCGLKAKDILLEIYKQETEPEYFLFYPAKKIFLNIPFSRIESIDLSGGISRKAKIIQELDAKNNRLRSNLNKMKTNIPEEVNLLLNEYYSKIAAMDFLDFIDDFDVQANILKAMLNTNSI